MEGEEQIDLGFSYDVAGGEKDVENGEAAKDCWAGRTDQNMGGKKGLIECEPEEVSGM